MIKNVYRSSCKVAVMFVRFWSNTKFLDRYSKITQTSNFMKIRPVGAELVYAEGRTDRHDDANSRSMEILLTRPKTESAG